MIATAAASADLDVFELAMGLLGGLALFLFGMDHMADALKALAGDRMKTILGKLTTNRFMGVGTGAFVTAVIQSSSVTTVLVVGFITAGLMSLSQSVGIIMGANIGSTVTAQLIAFKVTKFALLMITVGFAMLFVGKRERIRHYGAGLLGMGLVFFGMSVMSDAMKPLRSYSPFLDWMQHMESPMLGILAGTVFTALVQSSAATTGVVIAMASQGLISLPGGIAITFGANVGTCATALLASIGKPREALRAATVHVLFNVIGVVIWIPVITQLADFVASISPTAAGTLSEGERLAAETPRQIANAHTVFNVTNTFLFIWIAPLFARAAERLVPDRPIAEAEVVRAKYLDTELLATPSLALDRARLEILNMGDRVRDMYLSILPAVLHGTREELEQVADADDEVDAVYGQLVTYLGQISRTPLTAAQTETFLQLIEAANALESIGDLIETNLVNLGLQRIERGISVSPETQEVIRAFHGTVKHALDLALTAVTSNSMDAARSVMLMKEQVNELAEQAARHESRRLVVDEPNRMLAYSLETDILEHLKRIYYFAKRMGKAAERAAAVSS